MPKNVVIFFASPYKKDAAAYTYTDIEGKFAASCVQTNETALKYISWRLKQQQKKIDAAYAFATEAVCDNDFRRLVRELQAEAYTIKPIYFDEASTIDGSFNSINIMFDALSAAYAADEEITVHMDLTGGFRHSTVLMLALLRLMKYAGYKIGMVTYTNFNTKRIETVNELVEMFDLIGGAGDFTNNGNVSQLQEFFAHEKQSAKLQNLLARMDNFAECIKSCSESSVVLKAAKALQGALTIYKASLQDASSRLSAKEEFFARLIPVIEKEYAAIFNCSTKTASIPEFIRWCLDKGLLQQAATYATELIPVYLVDSELITINKPAIIEKCKKESRMWSNWQVHFLKNYQCKEMTDEPKQQNLTNAIGLDYAFLRVFLDQNRSAWELQKLIGDQNEKLSDFLLKLNRFSLNVHFTPVNILHALMELPEGDAIRYVVEASKPLNTDLNNYINKRLKSCKSVDGFVLSCLKLLSKEQVIVLFGMNKEATAAAKKEQISRAKQLLALRKSGIISSWLKDEQLQEIIDKYLKIVDYRNSISHAFGKTEGRAGNQSLKSLILEELDLITNIEI